MNARVLFVAIRFLFSMSVIVANKANAVDLFHTLSALPTTAAGSILQGHATCVFGHPGNPMSLTEAVERALCESPETRSAWTIIEERTAAVGVTKAAYLPTLSATGQLVHDNSVTEVRDHASLSSNYSSIVRSGSLQLGWLLYDFGGRRAALNNSEALLGAAEASENATIQQTFSDTAKAYYAAQAAQEQLGADDEIVSDAKNSSTAAEERIQQGAAPSTEGYQAETAYEQAVVIQIKDRGQALASLGTLASAVGLSPDTELTVDVVNQTQLAEPRFMSAVAVLMNQAEQTHPSVLAAEKQLEATQAAIVQAKAQGRPTLKLLGNYNRNNQPVQLGLGLPHYPATGHDGYVGVQVTVPLFAGFATHYQVKQAMAQRDQQSVALDKARQQVGLQVWISYQTLKTDTQNLGTSQRLQDVATEAWESAQRRYKSGIGNILELLNTQTALAQARQVRVEAITGWRYDRLALGSALGHLSWNDIRGD